MYRLISDDDGHWYVIHTGDVDDFYSWLNSSEVDVISKKDYSMNRIDGPESILFDKYIHLKSNGIHEVISESCWEEVV